MVTDNNLIKFDIHESFVYRVTKIYESFQSIVVWLTERVQQVRDLHQGTVPGVRQAATAGSAHAERGRESSFHRHLHVVSTRANYGAVPLC